MTTSHKSDGAANRPDKPTHTIGCDRLKEVHA